MFNKPYIVAEIGINHNGSLQRAKKLIIIAKKCGAHAIKTQTFIPRNLVTASSKMANYQIKNTKKNITQMKMLEKYTLSFSEQMNLFNFCKKIKIDFLSTPFDNDSYEFLRDSLKLKTLKISSGDIDNVPFLWKIAKDKKKIFLSTGTADVNTINQSLVTIYCGYNSIQLKNKNLKQSPNLKMLRFLKNKVFLLHCTTSYPTSLDEANMNSVKFLKDKYLLDVGFSDHTIGSLSSVLAVSMGARIFEKHLTLNKKLSGPDHICSTNPKEFSDYVKNIENSFVALGKYTKKTTKTEISNKKIVRKGIYAKQKINKGNFFKEDNLIIKRPETRFRPIDLYKILGKKAKKNYKIDDPI